jgi:NADH-quinone oxidoreductase subunit J
MDLLYFAASAVAVYSALMVVTRRSPIYAAAWMMVSLTAVAAVFIALRSPFLGVIQVLLYAGAILVLFLFVIMLLNPSKEDLERENVPAWQKICGLVVGLVLAGLLIAGILSGAPSEAVPFDTYPAPKGFGSTEYFGGTIYDRYLVAFELISVLVLAAIAAVVLVGKRQLLERRDAATGDGGGGDGSAAPAEEVPAHA